MKNNKGFSLVELIVVIAVMMILAGIVIVNYGGTTLWQLKQCTEEIDDQISNTKVKNLSGRDVELKLYMDDSDLIMNKTGTEDGDIPMGEYTVTVYYEDKTGAELSNMVLDGTGIEISFLSSTGEFNEIDTNKYLDKIEIAVGSYKRTIVCERLTGTTYIEE